MAIPSFQDMTLPVLQLLADDREHRSRDLIEPIADICQLSAEERAELLPSGRQRVIDNRVHWALGYLLRAGLISRVKRGVYRINDSGKQLLKSPPERLDVAYLKRHFPEFRAWREKVASGAETTVPHDRDEETDIARDDATPEESLEAAYQQIRQSLAEELLDQLKQTSPAQFEHIVIQVLVAMGYGGTHRDAARAVGRSGDGGIDGIIKEDRLGLDTLYIQAKRYTQQSVGRPEVQAFVGALTGQRARKGVLLTTSTFTADAHAYVDHIDPRIVLIDGRQLAEYMIDHDIGVTTAETYPVKRLDADFFEEDA